MKNKKLIMLLALIALTGCADTVSYEISNSVGMVGFWHGLWHGMIAPFAWLVSLFNDDVAIYAVYNTGGWYDFGFVLGIGGSSSATTTRRRKS